MLTSQQKERLNIYQTPSREGVNVVVTIHPKRKYPRETGGGFGHAITTQLIYLADGQLDQVRWISFCTTGHTAVEKAKEIARYLADDLGLTRDAVKLKDAR